MNVKNIIDFYQSPDRKGLCAPLDFALYNRWKHYFDHMCIFNMYDDHTSFDENKSDHQLFIRFICQAIPEAKHTCRALKNGTLTFPSSRMNAAENKVSGEALLLTLHLKKINILHFDENDKK